jgi:Fic family protein
MKKPEKPPKTSKLTVNELDYLVKNKLEELYKIEREGFPYWEDLKYKVKGWEVPPEKIWSFLKSQRLFTQQSFKFSEVPDFLFCLNIPGLIQKYLHEFDMHLGGMLEGEAVIPSEDKTRYLISSIMEESIASSQIEGAVTTRKVAKLMLEQNRKPRNKSEQMIMNNYSTMRWIIQHKNTKITPDSLLNIHSQITKGTLDDSMDEGRFRDNNDVRVMDDTNEVFYIPPDYKYISNLIKDLCRFANDEEEEKEFLHPIVKGIILHFMIGYIHPFVDGNGRTARTLFYWYLIKKGYWLTEYMSISRIILRAKSQYSRAFLYTEYDNNDLTYFILYNIKSMKAALDDLKKYIHKKTQEKKKILSLIKSSEYNDRQLVIIKDILKDRNQYFTVRQIEEKFSVSNQTARNDLTKLVNDKILIHKAANKRIQFFAADDFDKILNIK